MFSEFSKLAKIDPYEAADLDVRFHEGAVWAQQAVVEQTTLLGYRNFINEQLRQIVFKLDSLGDEQRALKHLDELLRVGDQMIANIREASKTQTQARVEHIQNQTLVPLLSREKQAKQVRSAIREGVQKSEAIVRVRLEDAEKKIP